MVKSLEWFPSVYLISQAGLALLLIDIIFGYVLLIGPPPNSLTDRTILWSFHIIFMVATGHKI